MYIVFLSIDFLKDIGTLLDLIWVLTKAQNPGSSGAGHKPGSSGGGPDPGRGPRHSGPRGGYSQGRHPNDDDDNRKKHTKRSDRTSVNSASEGELEQILARQSQYPLWAQEHVREIKSESDRRTNAEWDQYRVTKESWLKSQIAILKAQQKYDLKRAKAIEKWGIEGVRQRQRECRNRSKRARQNTIRLDI